MILSLKVNFKNEAIVTVSFFRMSCICKWGHYTPLGASVFRKTHPTSPCASASATLRRFSASAKKVDEGPWLHGWTTARTKHAVAAFILTRRKPEQRSDSAN